MTRVVPDDDRMFGRRLVEVAARGVAHVAQAGVVVAAPEDPAVRRQRRRGVTQASHDVGDGLVGRRPCVHPDQGGGVTDHVIVGLDEARQHGAAAGVDDAHARLPEREHVAVAAHRHDLAGADGHRGRRRAVAVHGQHLGIRHEQVHDVLSFSAVTSRPRSFTTGHCPRIRRAAAGRADPAARRPAGSAPSPRPRCIRPGRT